MIYLSLFSVSLLAATLLPGGSEAFLLYSLSIEENLFLLLLVATVGNTIGSAVNYWIGKKGVVFLRDRGYAKERHLHRAYDIFNRYGAAALLFSWVPVLGDPITFIAGLLKYEFKKFLLLVFFAKGVRYIVVALLYLQW